MTLTWVRNFSFGWQGKGGKKATSLWHLLHSVRASETSGRRANGFALTYCGQIFDNPRSRYVIPLRARKCSGCSNIERAFSNTVEIPDELVIREDAKPDA